MQKRLSKYKSQQQFQKELFSKISNDNTLIPNASLRNYQIKELNYY
jgi:hypothetical protein